MMQMLDTAGVKYTYAAGMFWLHLHWAFIAFTVVGFILLTVWALRCLQKEQLKTFTVWLLVFGIVGALITAAPAMGGWSWLFGGRGGHMDMKMMRQMHEMMVEHDEESGDEDHGEMLEMMESMMR